MIIMMHLVDVTASHAKDIQRELAATPVHFIKIYTLGNSRVVYKKKHGFSEIVISNKLRGITDKEIDFVVEKLLKNDTKNMEITKQKSLVEIIVNN